MDCFGGLQLDARLDKDGPSALLHVSGPPTRRKYRGMLIYCHCIEGAGTERFCWPILNLSLQDREEPEVSWPLRAKLRSRSTQVHNRNT